MKRLIIIIAVIVTSLASAKAQEMIIQVKPAGSKFWGYANPKGDIIIPAQYEKCYRFSADGLAAIYDKRAHQYFFINTKGEKLKTEVYDFRLHDGMGFAMEGFNDGLVNIKVGDKWGFMDIDGKIAISAKYDDVSEFNGGYAVAKSGATYMVLDQRGTEKIIQGGGITDVKHFSEGYAAFRAHDKRFGFVDTEGKIVIPAQYESVGYFSNGLAWAKTGNSVGYINFKGEWAIPPQFLAAKEFDTSTGLARIKTVTKMWAYTNTRGELTYINDTESYGDFSEGLCDGKKGGLKGFYDKSGKWVIPPQFQGTRDFKNGYAAAKVGGKWGLIDQSGKWVIQPTFDGIKDIEVIRPGDRH